MTAINQYTLDSIDLDILRALQQDARLTTRQLAAKVHRSPTPVFERVRRLETQGFIRRYAALLDADKLGQGFMVICQVKLRIINRDIASTFVEYVRGLPEVSECYHVSGSFDYILKVRASSMAQYRDFLLNKLGLRNDLNKKRPHPPDLIQNLPISASFVTFAMYLEPISCRYEICFC